jgi:hypothetical protein
MTNCHNYIHKCIEVCFFNKKIIMSLSTFVRRDLVRLININWFNATRYCSGYGAHIKIRAKSYFVQSPGESEQEINLVLHYCYIVKDYKVFWKQNISSKIKLKFKITWWFVLRWSGSSWQVLRFRSEFKGDKSIKAKEFQFQERWRSLKACLKWAAERLFTIEGKR